MINVFSPFSSYKVPLHKIRERFNNFPSVYCLNIPCVHVHEFLAYVYEDNVQLSLLDDLEKNLKITRSCVAKTNEVEVYSGQDTYLFNRDTLRRNFYYFDDLFQCFPEVTRVETRDVQALDAILHHRFATRLVDIHDELEFLQPKNKALFLEFPMTECSVELLDLYLGKLTKEDWDNWDAYLETTRSTQVFVDKSFRYRHFVSKSDLAVEIARKRFDESPSMCAMILVEPVMTSEDVSLLLSGKYETDNYVIPMTMSHTAFMMCSGFVCYLFGNIPRMTRKQLGVFMAMCGVKSTYFENETVVAYLPFGITASKPDVLCLVEVKKLQIEGVMKKGPLDMSTL